jgi:hypothetical protein
MPSLQLGVTLYRSEIAGSRSTGAELQVKDRRQRYAYRIKARD